MKTFVIHLQSATLYEKVENAVSFVGEDESGSFGIMAGHARAMTTLVFGLAKFRTGTSGWEYVALPGGLLYFRDNQLYVNTRKYFRSPEYLTMRDSLRRELQEEESGLSEMKENLRRLEREMFRRLWSLKQEV